jgi:LPXTG-motif cell wall-anchored protein
MLKDGSFTTTDPESTIDGAPVDKSTYASLTDKYAKVVSVSYEETAGETVSIKGVVGEDGILRFEGLKSGEYTITEIKAPEGYNMLTEELKVTISWDEESKDFTYVGAVDNNGVARITIVNQAGSELPSTGGVGTTVFYVVGGILLLAAVVLLVTKKRMAA